MCGRDKTIEFMVFKTCKEDFYDIRVFTVNI